MLYLKFFAISFLKSVWKAKYVWNEFVQALLERMQINKNCGVEGYSWKLGHPAYSIVPRWTLLNGSQSL